MMIFKNTRSAIEERREGGLVQRINNYTEQNVLPANQPSSFQSIAFISGLNSTGVPAPDAVSRVVG